MKNVEPPQIENELHVLDIPSMEDLRNLIDNGKNPENVQMFIYWMRQIDDFNRRLGNHPLNLWDDTIFLGVIEWQWFLEELHGQGSK